MHTPGPWKAVRKKDAGYRWVAKVGKEWKVVPVPQDRDVIVESAEADAHLIKAAPDLFALALKVERIAVRACGNGFCEWDDYMDAEALRREAHAVIAKVKGETNP